MNFCQLFVSGPKTASLTVEGSPGYAAISLEIPITRNTASDLSSDKAARKFSPSESPEEFPNYI